MVFKKVVWTNVATQSFNSIYDFTLLKWGTDTSESFLTLVDVSINRILQNNNIAPLIFYSNTFRRLVIHKNIFIFYQISENEIIVHLFWDNRQNSKELFNKLNNSR